MTTTKRDSDYNRKREGQKDRSIKKRKPLTRRATDHKIMIVSCKNNSKITDASHDVLHDNVCDLPFLTPSTQAISTLSSLWGTIPCMVHTQYMPGFFRFEYVCFNGVF